MTSHRWPRAASPARRQSLPHTPPPRPPGLIPAPLTHRPHRRPPRQLPHSRPPRRVTRRSQREVRRSQRHEPARQTPRTPPPAPRRSPRASNPCVPRPAPSPPRIRRARPDLFHERTFHREKRRSPAMCRRSAIRLHHRGICPHRRVTPQRRPPNRSHRAMPCPVLGSPAATASRHKMPQRPVTPGTRNRPATATGATNVTPTPHGRRPPKGPIVPGRPTIPPGAATILWDNGIRGISRTRAPIPNRRPPSSSPRQSPTRDPPMPPASTIRPIIGSTDRTN